MNQILVKKLSTSYQDSAHYKRLNILFKFSLCFSLICLFVCITFLVIHRFECYKNEKLSHNLKDSFSVTTLYSQHPGYTASFDTALLQSSAPFVIGTIDIPKIKISYPILSESSDSLLKIAPCRFAGPMPNEVGNLCIAGHNYVDNRFFSNISRLNISDPIFIVDSKGIQNEYIVFNKEEITKDSIEITNQNTHGTKIITLLTCNNVNGTRIVIQAKSN